VNWIERRHEMRSWSVALLFVVAVGLSTYAADAEVHDRTGVVKRRAVPEAINSKTRVFLELPHLRQETNLCVPTSAAMVLEYYGDPQAPRKLKVLSRGKTYDPDAPFDDYTITWWNDLLAGLETLGYRRWHAKGYANDEAGFRAGLQDVKASLTRGDPVLVDVALFGSHTMVVVGYDDDEQQVFFNDPNLSRSGVRVLTYNQLESIWNGLSYDRNTRPTLFTRPKE